MYYYIFECKESETAFFIYSRSKTKAVKHIKTLSNDFTFIEKVKPCNILRYYKCNYNTMYCRYIDINALIDFIF